MYIITLSFSSHVVKLKEKANNAARDNVHGKLSNSKWGAIVTAQQEIETHKHQQTLTI